MSHAQPMINRESLAPAAQGTAGVVGSQSSYNPGLSYLVGPALYELMKIWSEISILYQGLVTSVTKSSIAAATATSHFQIEQGEEARSQAISAGLGEALGGALVGATSLIGGFGADSELENLQAEKQGIEEYQTTLNDVMKEGSAGGLSEREIPRQSVESEMDELMDQESFAGRKPSTSENMVLDERGVARLSDKSTMKLANDQEQQKLSDAYKQKLKDVDTKIQGRIQQLQKADNDRMIRAQAVQGVSKGGGQAISGEFAAEQKKDEANATMAQAAQQVAQGIDNHFRSQVEKMVEAALQIISTLSSISRANKANG